MEMGQKIHSLRIQKGMTLEELGDMVGVGKSTVRKWENGMIANMKRDKILKVSEALGTSPAYLMGWDDKKQPKAESPKILQFYEQLNDIGKHVATERVEELTHLPKYINEDSDYVNAAHANEGATEEEKQHDEDIMDAEDF